MFKAHRVDQLIKELGDSNPHRRYLSEYILSTIGKYVIRDLIHGLEDQDEETTIAIAAIIIQIGSATLEALISALETTADPKLQHIILQIFGQIGDETTLESLNKRIGSSDPLLAKAAYDAKCAILGRQYRSLEAYPCKVQYQTREV